MFNPSNLNTINYRDVDPVATLWENLKVLEESKYQKTLKIATIACLSLISLQQTEMLGNSLLLIAI